MLNLFIRQPFTESSIEQQKVVQSVIDSILEMKDEFGINFLTPTVAQNADSFKKYFEETQGKEFTTANFRQYRLNLLDKADAFLCIRAAMSESSSFEIAYNIYRANNAPIFFAIHEDAVLKTTLLRNLDKDGVNESTYITFKDGSEIKNSLREFFAKISNLKNNRIRNVS